MNDVNEGDEPVVSLLLEGLVGLTAPSNGGGVSSPEKKVIEKLVPPI